MKAIKDGVNIFHGELTNGCHDFGCDEGAREDVTPQAAFEVVVRLVFMLGFCTELNLECMKTPSA